MNINEVVKNLHLLIEKKNGIMDAIKSILKNHINDMLTKETKKTIVHLLINKESYIKVCYTINNCELKCKINSNECEIDMKSIKTRFCLEYLDFELLIGELVSKCIANVIKESLDEVYNGVTITRIGYLNYKLCIDNVQKPLNQ